MAQNAVIYSRFSSAEQSKGFSLERQQTCGREFAVNRGWQIEKLIADEGRSAFHGLNRLEGAALHGFELEARNGLHRGKVLVVENIDRLSRQGAKAAAQLIWGLNENGVDVATYHDCHVYASSASGDMMDIFKLVILAQQSHEESANKSRRTTATWEKRFKAITDGKLDKSIPHVPVWVMRTDDGYELNEYRCHILNEIYDWYIDGLGIHRIVTALNARGEPSWTSPDHDRHANGWFYSYIFRLLTKRSVLGEYVTGDGETLSLDYFPQAITTEKWERAQAALLFRRGNQRRSKTVGNRNLLANMVACDTCGGGAHYQHTTDTTQKYRKANGEVVEYARKTYRRLRCDRARRGHACDNDTILNYDVVEATMLDELLPELIERQGRSLGEFELREQIAELTRKRAADQTRLTNLVDALADGGAKAIVARVAELERSIEVQTGTIAELEEKLTLTAALPSNVDDGALIAQLRSQLTAEDDEVRINARGRVNMALRRLVKRIAICANGTYRIEPDDHSWWLFDADGRMLEGERILA